MYGRKQDVLDNGKKRVRKLYHTGLTDKEIADELGVTRAAVSLWRKRNDLPRNSRKGRMYTAWHHRAVLLYSQGWTVDAISSLLEKKRATVQQTLLRKASDR